MKGIENTVTINFGELIGNNKKFMVPLFQRDYSWEEEQWDDLWQDLVALADENSDHYMGYLVLQSPDKTPSQFRIIDGQQRFTTITIILLAILKAIKNLGENGETPEDNNSRFNSLMGTYIGRLDPVSLSYDNILILNKNDNSYFRDYIVKLGDLRARGLITSQKLLRQCFLWYESRVNALGYSGKDYADFLIKAVDSLYFTVITVNDDMNAFRVFETLNARGVQLSSADLLKNYLFSLVDDGQSEVRLGELEYHWNELAQNVRTEKLPDFIRYFWNTRNKSIRSSELFKAIKKKITDARQVFEFVKEMMDYSDVYMALLNSDDDMWAGDMDIRRDVELLKIFGLKQPLSLLMCAYRKLELSQFKHLLRSIIIVCFRYNVICSKNPNEIEKVFNDMALAIYAGEGLNLSMLRNIYISDSEFENSFALKSLNIARVRDKISMQITPIA